MDSNNSFEDWLLTKYYIFGGLFQLIWGLGVLGFTLFMVNFFNNPYYLFLALMVLLRPCVPLKKSEKKDSKSCTDDNKHKPSDYGTNNPR